MNDSDFLAFSAAGGLRLQAATEAARKAGRLLLHQQGRIGYREKGARDLVTAADLAAQKLIFQRIAQDFGSDELLGEEDAGGRVGPKIGSSPALWVVDPLDGTTNFVHGLPHYCVSIGWLAHGIPQLGVIYDPHRDELFAAVAGHGAFLGNQRLEVSNIRRLESALVAVSFAAQVARGGPEVADFLGLLGSAQAVRRLGSAALNLAYLAAGRFDAYWARNGKLWDVAAGVLLVAEAGGVVTGVDGAPFDPLAPHLAAAATAELHEELTRAAQSHTENE